MRVLHAFNQHRGGGGANNATRATIDASVRRGLTVEVLARSSRDLPDGWPGRLRAAAGALYQPASVREFASKLDAFGPDVVHVHELFPLVSPGILPLCSRRGIPVVMSFVDYRYTCPVATHTRDGAVCTRCVGGREHWAVLNNCRNNLPESLLVAVYGAAVRSFGLYSRHVRRYIAPSEFTRRWLVDQGRLAPGQVTTNAPLVEIPERPSDPAQGRYLAYAGRFAPEKGISCLLEAGQRTAVPLRLARSRESLLTMSLPPEADVVVTDGREDLDVFYRGARAVVVPSTWFETFGLVGAEAMSRGIPVVASRIGALAELVEDGVDGFLFEPGNPRDLADKLSRLWSQPALAARLGQAARQKALRLWSEERHLQVLTALYAEVGAVEGV